MGGEREVVTQTAEVSDERGAGDESLQANRGSQFLSAKSTAVPDVAKDGPGQESTFDVAVENSSGRQNLGAQGQSAFHKVIEYLAHNNGLVSMSQISVVIGNAELDPALHNIVWSFGKMLIAQTGNTSVGSFDDNAKDLSDNIKAAPRNVLTAVDRRYIVERQQITVSEHDHEQARRESGTPSKPGGESPAAKKKREQAASFRLADTLKVLKMLSKVEGLGAAIEPIQKAIKLAELAQEGGSSTEWIAAVSEVGEALFKSLGALMEAIANGDDLAIEAAGHLGKLASVFGLPGSVYEVVDNICKIARGHDLKGKEVDAVDRWMSVFKLAKAVAGTAKGLATVVGPFMPRLAGYIGTVGEVAGWSNPVTIGITVTYEELKFLTKHVYGPAHEHLTSFLSTLRTGGQAGDIEEGLRRRPVTNSAEAKELVRDVAPQPVGSGHVFGQGTTGWGWSKDWAHYFTTATHKGGQLHQYHQSNYAGVPTLLNNEREEIQYANAVREVAIAFIESQIQSGKVGRN